ncbi:hsc70-interacting protein isoform X1 [Dendrobates tinctorius]|uniref:hsc70-interacting protein isoform X1 n=1 Tax=Dendrobates tinctorius TaxID=92724 RepID=UPI003CC97E68
MDNKPNPGGPKNRLSLSPASKICNNAAEIQYARTRSARKRGPRPSKKGVLQEVPLQDMGRGFYSPLFLVTKPDGTFRTIINLRKLNKYVKNQSFKMESIKSTTKVLFPTCYMTVLDLSNAYYHVPIHKDSRKYLRLAVSIKGKVKEFQYRALPFGISIALRVFTKIVAEMMAHIRERYNNNPVSRRFPNSSQLGSKIQGTERQGDEHSSRPRLASKSKKIKIGAQQGTRILGPNTRLKHSGVSPPRPQKGEDRSNYSKSNPKSLHDTKEGYVTAGFPIRLPASSSMGSVTHERSPVGRIGHPGSNRGTPRGSHYPKFKNYSFPSLVGKLGKSVQRDPLGNKDNTHSDNGCQSHGMGSAHEQRGDSERMGKSRTKSLLKSKRAFSSRLCPDTLPIPAPKSPCPHSFRTIESQWPI